MCPSPTMPYRIGRCIAVTCGPPLLQCAALQGQRSAALLLFCLICPYTRLDDRDRLLRSTRRGHPEGLAPLTIVRNEEFFDLGQQCPAHLVDRRDLFVLVRVNRHTE